MRVDKFLKVSRLIKRRSVAKEASEESKILVNGKVAKPSTVLKIGDILEIRYFKSVLKVKIKALLNSSKKEDAQLMYDVIEVVEHKD